MSSPRSIELGRMAVAVIVHPENPLESLPMDEARAIFSGEIKKWPAVRGAAAAMHVFGLEQSSPITQLLKEKLGQAALSGGPAQRKTWTFKVQFDSEKVILAVARDPAAIGFVDLGRLPPKEKSVKLVPVFERSGTGGEGPGAAGGQRAEGGTRRSSSIAHPAANPLSRTLTLYVSPNASRTAKDFAEFLTPEHCKETIAKYNLLPPLPAAGQLAKVPPPRRDDPQIRLAAADEPLPRLLDDPDSPQDQPRAKDEKPVAKPEVEVPAAVDAPVPPQPVSATSAASAATPEAASQPAQGRSAAPSLFDKQTTWIAGGIAGVVVVALGAGWLSAAKPKKKRR